MVNNREQEIIKYLNKTYIVKEKLFFNKYDNNHEWGLEIVEWLINMFPINSGYDNGSDFITKVIFKWAESFGLNESEIKNAWVPRKLNAKWSLNMEDELVRLGVTNVQLQMINLLIEDLSKEIDTTILKELKPKIKTIDDLFSLVNCVGYKKKPVSYNPTTFLPEYGFISVKYHEMLNERQSNNIWQNHFRPTRVDEQTQVTS